MKWELVIVIVIVSENYKRPQVAFKLRANGHCLNLAGTEKISKDY